MTMMIVKEAFIQENGLDWISSENRIILEDMRHQDKTNKFYYAKLPMQS